MTGRPQPAEVPFLGGTANRGRIVRSGDTVRRPLRRTSDSTRAVLDHLDRAGFDGAPRWLGVDGRGREVLSYVTGTAPMVPYPSWALTDAALVSVADLLRRFHAAVQGFPGLEHPWQRDVPPPFRTSHVSHNDPNLDNVVFRDGVAVALIDFDLAGAGSPVWDLAMAARLWCPLRAPEDVQDERQGRGLERLATFLDAYGADRQERGALADAVLSSHRWAYDHVEREVARGHEAFTAHWVGNRARERSARTWEWLVEHQDDVTRTARG